MCGSRAMKDICFIYSFQHRFIGDLFMPHAKDKAVSKVNKILAFTFYVEEVREKKKNPEK